jgi:two-component system, NarL family, nitrate/nitrite sensor histidine kinase NarX
VGFDPAAVNTIMGAGFGLQIMRERAERLGAALGLASTPGGGTEVLVVLP